MCDGSSFDGSAVNHKELIGFCLRGGRNAVVLTQVLIDEIASGAGIEEGKS